MEWTTTNEVQRTFASLYVPNGDTILVNDDCLATLEEILQRLHTEDCKQRPYRRAVGFGQNIKKHLMPLLIHLKDNTKTADTSTRMIDAIIKILVNLTIPVEYLLPVESIHQTKIDRQAVHELNKLLTSSKEIFTDSRSTKAILDHMRYVIEGDSELNVEQCETINNCLLLLRNILHVPESKVCTPNGSLTLSSMQNQIIWSLFTQSIDKLIIYLMSCPQNVYWAVTMVQLIALMYKDQHVGTLQKLLNIWLESSYSESSEDNESNTSPPDQGSSGDGSSPIVTSDPTSDSSDNGGNDRAQHNQPGGNNNVAGCKGNSSPPERTKTNQTDVMRAWKVRSKSIGSIQRNKSTETENGSSSGVSSMGQSIESDNVPSLPVVIQSQQHEQQGQQQKPPSPQSSTSCSSSILGTPSLPSDVKKTVRPSSQSEISDCGYATQVENQESISTSSNDDDQPHQKPVHQKPHTFQKTRYNANKGRATTALEKKELRKKKLVKRSKTNIINMKGLMHHLPTDEDISNILKEFTVDFLLKGYGHLVNNLHSQFITNIHVKMDTSHFFWLVTYFLKFATQLELDPELINPVLSYDVLSYLIFQGVWVYEELEISCGMPNIDLKPCLRRLHLVVTAIREFLQGIETYQKMIHLSDAERENLAKLQGQIKKTEDLKMLFVLLLRQYNPIIQSRQYLQDLILTNHNFLLFLDNTCKAYNWNFNMVEHLKLFATAEIMRQYGLMLESFKENGEFVNNCIFTMMHHIGGDLQNVHTLFQPSILKTFSQIWETDYEICDDWSDLIEYVIHKFINTPGTHCTENTTPPASLYNEVDNSEEGFQDSNNEKSEWTADEKDNLIKYYNHDLEPSDALAKITEKYEENGMKRKTQLSIIKELLEQNMITELEYNDLMRSNRSKMETTASVDVNMLECAEDENKEEDQLVDSDIKVIKEYLYRENKGKFVIWLQAVLMETCYVKLALTCPEDFKDDDNVMEPTVYYYAMLNLPIPVIPWTAEQTNILKHQPFILLLHKLGFYLPVDTGKLFVRIPNFWTADYIFSIAQQLGTIDPGKLKFDINKLNGMNKHDSSEVRTFHPASFYESGKFSMVDLKHTPSVVRYTPLTSQLSIRIPEPEIMVNIPPPELMVASPLPSATPPSIERRRGESALSRALCDDRMDCSPMAMLELERASNCDTASVASDLTRMYVSDEEEKVTLIIATKATKGEHPTLA